MRHVLATLLLVALAACAGTTDDGGDVVAAGDPRAGAALYADNCAVCHGADLRGSAAGPSLLHEVYEPSHHADAAFLLAVQRGVQPHHWEFGAMPPIPGLSQQDVDDIIAFVREEQRAVGIE